MSSLVKLVGINIKELRKGKKMTQEVLAEKCGLQTSYLAGVERGDRNITLDTLEKIIVGLEVTPLNIFNFKNIKIDQNELKRNENVMLLHSLLESKSEKETRMILNIATQIFNNYE